ncbi:unannotated protein [freshwater metagenome]|uniref:Unannotated protein n=1 Tax=freshwater metagenome TaxID=449393 RepID=A0A6J6NT64_9ZZZZ
MVSTKTGDAHTIRATTAQKIAKGDASIVDTTTDNGTTIRTMVSEIGDGTSNDTATLVHNNHPHVVRTHATAREESSAMDCHGDDNARTAHATTTTAITMRSGRSRVNIAISLALPAGAPLREFPSSFPNQHY